LDLELFDRISAKLKKEHPQLHFLSLHKRRCCVESGLNHNLSLENHWIIKSR